MNAATLGAICLLLASLSTVTAESYNPASNNLLRRQDPAIGNCTNEELQELNERLDPNCLTNLNFLVSLSANLSSGVLIEVPFNEMSKVAENVCADTCIRVQYTIFTECFPQDQMLESRVRLLTSFCSSNGKTICGLARYKLNNSERLAFTSCIFQWMASQSSERCTTTCKQAHQAAHQELGCCSGNIANIFLRAFNITQEEFYSTCEIDNPGFCTYTFQDSNSGTSTVGALNVILVSLLTIGLHTYWL